MDSAISDFFSVLIQGLLVLAIPILIAFAIPWLRQKANEVKQKLSADQLDMLQKGAQFAVKAAEQAGLSGQIKNVGKEKKEFAISAAQGWLDRAGLKVNADEIASMIESEVHSQITNPTPMADSAESRSQLLEKAINVAVLAAQQGSVQEFANRLATGLIDSQKDYAAGFVKKYLDQYGLKVDPDIIDGLINAEVLKLRLQSMRAK